MADEKKKEYGELEDCDLDKVAGGGFNYLPGSPKPGKNHSPSIHQQGQDEKGIYRPQDAKE